MSSRSHAELPLPTEPVQVLFAKILFIPLSTLFLLRRPQWKKGESLLLYLK